MAKLIDSRVEEAQDALSANALAIIKVRKMKRVDLARLIEADGGGVLKTTYNILAKKHPPNIENWSFVAKALQVPLWVLLVPGLHDHEEILQDDGLKRLAKLVANYLACDDEKRRDADTVAQAGAIVRRTGK